MMVVDVGIGVCVWVWVCVVDVGEIRLVASGYRVFICLGWCVCMLFIPGCIDE